MEKYIYIIFNLLELQYSNLSIDEQRSFVKDLNGLFYDYEINWVFVDGKIIKVDAEQFDFDILAFSHTFSNHSACFLLSVIFNSLLF